MAAAVDGIAAFLIANVEGIDANIVTEAAEAYHGELEALDAEVEALVADIPAENRVLITNHEVFGYFADRYGFEVRLTTDTQAGLAFARIGFDEVLQAADEARAAMVRLTKAARA